MLSDTATGSGVYDIKLEVAAWGPVIDDTGQWCYGLGVAEVACGVYEAIREFEYRFTVRFEGSGAPAADEGSFAAEGPTCPDGLFFKLLVGATDGPDSHPIVSESSDVEVTGLRIDCDDYLQPGDTWMGTVKSFTPVAVDGGGHPWLRVDAERCAESTTRECAPGSELETVLLQEIPLPKLTPAWGRPLLVGGAALVAIGSLALARERWARGRASSPMETPAL